MIRKSKNIIIIGILLIPSLTCFFKKVCWLGFAFLFFTSLYIFFTFTVQDCTWRQGPLFRVIYLQLQIVYFWEKDIFYNDQVEKFEIPPDYYYRMPEHNLQREHVFYD